MRFVVENLDVPHLGRAPAEPAVLFLRLLAARPRADVDGRDAVVAVLPQAAQALTAALDEAAAAGSPIERVVLVGTDLLLSARALESAGHDDAVGALVDVLGALAARRVPFTWRTRGGLVGSLPSALSDALVAGRDVGALEIGVPTLDLELCTALEGRAGAAPEDRLRLATAVAARGMPVRALIEPLVPMLTDQQGSLEPLLVRLAEAGVHRVGARYLVLTRGRARALTRRLTRMQRALIEGCFAGEPWQRPDPAGESASLRDVHKLLPPNLRRRGHHRLEEAAARAGILVDILDPPSADELRAHADADEGGAAEARAKAATPRPQLDLFPKAR